MMINVRKILILSLFVLGFKASAQNDFGLIGSSVAPPYDSTNVITCFEKVQDHYKSIIEYFDSQNTSASTRLKNEIWEDARNKELYNHLNDTYLTVDEYLFKIDDGTLNLTIDIGGAQVEEIYFVQWVIGAGSDATRFNGLIFHITGLLVDGQLREEFILLKEREYVIQRVSKGLSELQNEWPVAFENTGRLGISTKVPVDPNIEEIEKAHRNLLNNYYEQIVQLSQSEERASTIESSLKSLLVSSSDEDQAYNYVAKERSSFDALFQSIKRDRPLIYSRPDRLVNRYSSAYGPSNRQGVLYEVELFVDRQSISEFVLVTKPDDPSASKIESIYSSLSEAEKSMKTAKDPRFIRDVVSYSNLNPSLTSDVVKRNKERLTVSWTGGDAGESLDFNLYDGENNLGRLPADQISIQGNQLNWTVPKKFGGKGLGGRKYRIELLGLSPVKSPGFQIKKRNGILWNLLWALPGSLVALDRAGVINLGIFPSKTVFENKPAPPCPPGVDNCN